VAGDGVGDGCEVAPHDLSGLNRHPLRRLVQLRPGPVRLGGGGGALRVDDLTAARKVLTMGRGGVNIFIKHPIKNKIKNKILSVADERRKT
jgi:hypothetical protein